MESVQSYRLLQVAEITVVFLLLSNFHATLSKRVLLVPCPVGSHILQANSIADGLLARGHEVSAIWNVRGKSKESVMNPKVSLLRYDTGHIPVFADPDYERKLLSMELEGVDAFPILEELSERDISECKRMLGNKQLEDAVMKGMFDFVVVDGIYRCLVIFPDRMKVPFAIYMSFLPADMPHAALQGPLLVHSPFDNMFTDWEDSFYTKLIRVGVTFLFSEPDVYGEFSNRTTSDIIKNFSLWLYDVSSVFETPLPVSPNVIHVGGLNTRVPKPLEDGELKHFMDSSRNGVIIVSFGSFVHYFPDWLTNILIDTFSGLPYDIVWKLNKDSITSGQSLSKNVFAIDWIPQNDILGHPNTKLFITHCGNSGQHEALYNQVPMLGIPLFGDQVFNAKRLEWLRFGLYLRPRDLSKDKLSAKINDILTNKTISEGISKASHIFHDQLMPPKETAAYWIEHVMQHGAGHLKSATNELSWFQILMFDVLLVMCLTVFLTANVLYCFCRCFLIRCYRQGAKNKLKTS
ncbi:UDP-glucuronosyltransferase 1-2-like [Lineus longissimus]|uniref:UDP-glucuronosyltransferase 1-2-like n=1 Tax=Lineus longissimus TaxID=88925 RepID=UPI00315DD54F